MPKEPDAIRSDLGESIAEPSNRSSNASTAEERRAVVGVRFDSRKHLDTHRGTFATKRAARPRSQPPTRTRRATRRGQEGAARPLQAQQARRAARHYQRSGGPPARSRVLVVRAARRSGAVGRGCQSRSRAAMRRGAKRNAGSPHRRGYSLRAKPAPSVPAPRTRGRARGQCLPRVRAPSVSRCSPARLVRRWLRFAQQHEPLGP